MTKVFIDGKEGTTGLKILQRFEKRKDIQLLEISEDLRKEPAERKKLINQSDITFLCLPDDTAKESVSLVENKNVKIIDASTAHRTNSEWTYGFPELNKDQRQKIAQSNRVAVPGCHASGFVSLVYPLIASGILQNDYPVTCHSVTGYSGGGKKMIAEYENKSRDIEYSSPRQYALTQSHKHIKEMKAVTDLQFEPTFSPIVADFYCGMAVSVPLFSRLLQKKLSAKEMQEFFAEYYSGQYIIKVLPFLGEGVLKNGFLPANALADLDSMQIIVSGSEDKIMLTSRFDNLGKGASGAAVQCMNIMTGNEEDFGLSI